MRFYDTFLGELSSTSFSSIEHPVQRRDLFKKSYGSPPLQLLSLRCSAGLHVCFQRREYSSVVAAGLKTRIARS
jgi:hypothetical protein